MDKLRREKGTGSVYQTKDGKWHGVYEVGGRDENNHRKTKSFIGKTELEVRKKMKAWSTEQAKYSSENIRNMTLKTYITNWLEVYKEPSLKPNSYKRLKCSVDTYVIPAIGHITIGNLSTDDVQSMINSMTKQTSPQLSFSSIKKVRDAINSCLQDGVDKGDFERNVCTAVKLPSVDKRKPAKEIRVFTNDEKKAIVTECKRVYSNGKPVYHHGYMYILILNTGMRLGEALALKWSNVDFNSKTIHIDSTLIRVKDGPKKTKLTVQETPKTSSSIRDIPLNKTAITALQELKATDSKTFVAESKPNTPIIPENFEKTFYRILANCDIPKAGCHAMRHTFASDLFEKGVDLKTISTLLGHSSIAVTANIYISVRPKVLTESVTLLDED